MYTYFISIFDSQAECISGLQPGHIFMSKRDTHKAVQAPRTSHESATGLINCIPDPASHNGWAPVERTRRRRKFVKS